MNAVGYGAGDTLELPDGKRCLVLSFDFRMDQVRILWTRGKEGHEDVDTPVLSDAVTIPKSFLEREVLSKPRGGE